MEADFAHWTPDNQADIKPIVEEEGEQHTPIVGPNFLRRSSGHKTQKDRKSSKRDGESSPSYELSSIRANAMNGHPN